MAWVHMGALGCSLPQKQGLLRFSLFASIHQPAQHKVRGHNRRFLGPIQTLCCRSSVNMFLCLAMCLLPSPEVEPDPPKPRPQPTKPAARKEQKGTERKRKEQKGTDKTSTHEFVVLAPQWPVAQAMDAAEAGATMASEEASPRAAPFRLSLDPFCSGLGDAMRKKGPWS